jgi:hypothetical protein
MGLFGFLGSVLPVPGAGLLGNALDAGVGMLKGGGGSKSGGGSSPGYNRYLQRLKSLESDTASWGDDAVSNAIEFDPSAAVNQYAQGAWDSTSIDLGKTLDMLRGQAVGAGRLDTGLFDYDQGEVMKEALNRFTAQLSQQSMNAAGLQNQNNAMLLNFLNSREGAINEGYAGMLDYETGMANAKGQSKSGLYGALGQLGGSAIGMLPSFISLFRKSPTGGG